MTAPGSSSWKPCWLPVVLAFLVYLPSFSGGFLWDDDWLVTANPLMREPWGWLRAWIRPPASQPDYFPLTTSVFWLQYQLWGGWAPGYRVVNALLHAVGVWMLLDLLRALRFRGAWWAALVWAVHPVNAASVAWISELKNTLSLPLALAAFRMWVKHQETGATRHGVQALGLYLLALSAKSAVVSLAPILVLQVIHSRGGQVPGRRDLLRLAPWFLLALVFGLLTIHFQHGRALAVEELDPRGMVARVAGAGVALGFYLWKASVPLDLMAIYPQWAAAPVRAWQFVPLVVVAAGAWMCWRHRRTWGAPLAFGAGSYLFALAPMLGLIAMSYHRHSLVADHFQYHALTAFAAMVACGARSLPVVRAHLRMARVAGAAVVAVLCVLTCRHGQVHRSEESLWRENLEKNPRSWQAHHRLGVVHAARGEFAAAAACFEQSIAQDARFAEVHQNLGILRLREGRSDEAIACFRRAIAASPRARASHMNLCVLLLATGDDAAAAESARNAVRAHPEDPEILGMAGYIHLKTGDTQAAAEVLATAVGIDPRDALALTNHAVALHGTGRASEAVAALEQAMRAKPGYPPAVRNMQRLQRGESTLEPTDQR